MPSIFLSPSVQEFNDYVNGGNEEFYMNLIADAMVPYLNASNVYFTRNKPNESLSQAISDSNAGNYDLHLSLHSNAGPINLAGQLKGPDVYYYATSNRGKEAANIIADNLKDIYPIPELVTTVPNVTLAELRRVKAPAVLVEIAYHDNYADAQWIKDNINGIARNLVLSVTEFLGVPFVDPYSAT